MSPCQGRKLRLVKKMALALVLAVGVEDLRLEAFHLL
jgi:hypothetical protein